MTQSRSTVLVTGGAGFIGCAISQLLAPHQRVVAVDNLHPQIHPDRTRPGALHDAAELIVADVTEPATWDAVLPEIRPQVIIHLAAETGTGQSLDESTRHGMVNVIGTTQLLDGLTRTGVDVAHLLLSSSRAVYGEGAWDFGGGDVRYPGQRPHARLAAGEWDYPAATSLPSRADRTRPDPSSVYGATKLAQEHILGAWCRARSVPLTILRLQNVYGPGQSLTNSYTGIVTLFAQLARSGKPIPLYEDGLVTRDFVFIDDIARAFEAALAHRPEVLALFDVGSGSASTIAELAGMLAESHGAPAPNVTGQFRDGDVRHASCEIERTMTALGWAPKVDLAAGLGQLDEWITSVL